MCPASREAWVITGAGGIITTREPDGPETGVGTHFAARPAGPVAVPTPARDEPEPETTEPKTTLVRRNAMKRRTKRDIGSPGDWLQSLRCQTTLGRSRCRIAWTGSVRLRPQVREPAGCP
jgi:hypothetical protein